MSITFILSQFLLVNIKLKLKLKNLCIYGDDLRQINLKIFVF
jgi:hypothetical protein